MFEHVFTQCLRTLLLKVLKHVYPMFYDMFTLKTCLSNFWGQFYPMIKDIVTQTWKTCSGNVQRPVHHIFEDIDKTCLPNVCRHIYPMFEDIFTQILKTCFPIIWWYVYPMFDEMVSQYLKTCLPNVWRYVYQMSKDMSIEEIYILCL